MTNSKKLKILQLEYNTLDKIIKYHTKVQEEVFYDLTDLLEEEERLNNLVTFCNTGKYPEEELTPEDIYNLTYAPEWLAMFLT